VRRLVAVSNRVGPVRGAVSAGGLAVALVDALRHYEGLWFGWSGRVVDGGEPKPKLAEEGGLTLATMDLPRQDYEDYYIGYANRCLWPLFHFRIDLTGYDRRFAEGYRRVNARFAQALSPLLRPDDMVWVHDYHLFELGSELRALGARQRIGFFLHIPFPPREILLTLPNHEQLVRALFDYDLLGFQTEQDLARFCDYVVQTAGGRMNGSCANAFGRRVETGVFPVGIDTAQFRDFAFSPRGEHVFRHMRDALRGRCQIIGVDRLDYSKGLLRRIGAFEALLDTHADTRGHVEYLQIAPISRGELKAYRDFRRDLEGAAARVNGRFGRVDWTPMHYLNRTLPRRTLAGLFRASQIGLVTPMRDGMNLVAKEYIAAQDPADPGVLVLSQFAGAAQQMKAALLVNPYDVTEVAEAMQRARLMPLAERKARYTELMNDLLRYDAAYWSGAFIDALRQAQLRRASGQVYRR
jgi:trehalose 6-phosphate synthase